MADKRYFWLKMPGSFFQQKEIRGLRRLEAGPELVIIYQEIMLLSIGSNGRILFEKYAPTLAEEIADNIGEDPDKIQIVLDFLEDHGLLEHVTTDEIELPGVVKLIGSESEAAERMRRARARKKEESADQEAESVTPREQRANNVQKCYTEIEKEKELEKETESELEKDTVDPPDRDDTGEPVAVAGKKKADPVPYKEILEAYNEICGDVLPHIQRISGNRQKVTAARYKEAGSLEALRLVFSEVRASDFLTGRNGNAWHASFDWIMKAGNFQKIQEGNYQNRRKQQQGTLSTLAKIYAEEDAADLNAYDSTEDGSGDQEGIPGSPENFLGIM